MGGSPALAIVVKRFPRLSETFVLNEFLELRRQGVPVRLFALADPHEPHVQPDAEELRPEVTYLQGGPPWRRAWAAAAAVSHHPDGVGRALAFGLRRRSRATWRHLFEALVLVDHLDREGVGHLHAHFAHSPSAVADLAHRVSGVSYSFTAHAKDLYTTPSAYVAARGLKARFVVTCTEANGTYLHEAVGLERDKVFVCRHGVDLDRFIGVPRRPLPGRILSVGRLVPKKGFDNLIRACAVLAERGTRFECVIVGDGPERERLQALAQELGVGASVHLEHGRPQPALLAEYGRAEVFALCPTVMTNGDRDGLPNVLLEAMAAGVPVVATKVSAVPELVVDGVTGRLVPPEDPRRFADALQQLLDDPVAGQLLATAGRAYVTANFDLAQCVRPLAARFQDCLTHAGELVGG